MTVGRVLLVLIGIWILLAIIGFVVKALFWLGVIALVALGFTLAGGTRRMRR